MCSSERASERVCTYVCMRVCICVYLCAHRDYLLRKKPFRSCYAEDGGEQPLIDYITVNLSQTCREEAELNGLAPEVGVCAMICVRVYVCVSPCVYACARRFVCP